jgi:NhaP-type Na+/H+ or K+/H+ antiporter
MAHEHELLISLASIVALGMGAQWLAWRLSMPSILLLLLAGFVAGPVTGLINPNDLFGELLFPVVSLSVAIILFEGGMSLRLNELQSSGRVIRNLVSIGALVTWFICSMAAIWIIGMPPTIAMLLGAILVVTGPTVIGPLLRVVKPSKEVGAILKWEGIVIDPVGATLAVLVFEAILAGELQAATAAIVEGVIRTILAGSLLGTLGAALIVLFLRRYWIPDFLQNPFVLMVVVTVFTMSNLVQEESGLLAVTVMGVVLANQSFVVIKDILHFKEDLRVLLIGSLFILLTARLQIDRITAVGLESLLFLGVVLFVARPASVMLSTMRSGLNWRERLFLAWMAPRGIVAASVASLFALRMFEAEIAGAEQLVPVTFVVILGTVATYSLTALPVARWLRIAQPNPQGVLIVGAHSLARVIGRALHEQNFPVLLIDTNAANCEVARAMGLPAFHGSILDPEIHNAMSLGGIGRLMALTANDEVNALAALEWSDVFGSVEVYQLTPHRDVDLSPSQVSQSLRGRQLFRRGMTYTHIMGRMNRGAQVTTVVVDEAIERSSKQESPEYVGVPLFVINEDRTLTIVTSRRPLNLRVGQKLIKLVDTADQEPYDDAHPHDLEQLKQSV